MRSKINFITKSINQNWLWSTFMQRKFSWTFFRRWKSLIRSIRWCAPCSRIAPKVDEWSENQFKDTVLFLKVDIDEAEALTQKFDVEAMPTFLFFKDGKEIHRFIGVNYVQLEKDIQDRIWTNRKKFSQKLNSAFGVVFFSNLKANFSSNRIFILARIFFFHQNLSRSNHFLGEKSASWKREIR